MPTKKNSVAKQLQDSAKTFEQRNKVYGDSYMKNGKIMKEFFPDGVDLTNENEFLRYSVFSAIVGKLNRYSNNFKSGGHHDSLHDISVYAAMLNDIDGK